MEVFLVVLGIFIGALIATAAGAIWLIHAFKDWW